ncbi:MAG: hypothetical protein GXP24_13680 [Planctomycetes bacterium]|nr:hypothetical protein [Planctomycetota bacterium]
MPAIFILIVLVFLAFIVVGGIYSHRKQKEREAALRHLASELGWQFHPIKNRSHHQEFPLFSIFTTGEARYAYNTLRGMLSINGSSWQGQMGDYHYETTSNSGKNKTTHTHRFSYLLVKMPYTLTPSLKIRREQLFDRMASFIGFDDIDFESAEFSDRFHVKSSDKRFAYDVIHPRMMEFLLAENPPSIHLEGGYCCIYTENRCWPPAKFRDNATWMQEFFSHWPSHITSTLPS